MRDALRSTADWPVSYIPMGGFSALFRSTLNNIGSRIPQELQMSQNAKDSKSVKTNPVKDTADSGGKKSDKGSADKKTGSPTGSQKKGEKKTTP